MKKIYLLTALAFASLGVSAQKQKLARHGLRRLLTEMSDRIGAVPRTHTNGSQYRMRLPQTANQATMYAIVT